MLFRSTVAASALLIPASGRVADGSDRPVEVTEVWTFVRPRGSNWELSAIQQTN